MKIALISPYEDIGAPGVRSLSSCLHAAGHEVTIFFLRHQFLHPYEQTTLDQLMNLLNGYRLIGISLMTNYFDNTLQITRRIRKENLAPVIWGGVHPTVAPEECLEHADMICVGEGEEALVELANRFAAGNPWEDVQNIWFMRGNEVVRNPLRPLIQDLEAIPIPDCDFTKHFILDDSGSILPIDLALLEKYTTGQRYLAIPTRGCPYGCTYCCNNTLNRMYRGQKLLRKRIGKSIIEELLEAKRKMPFITNILFDDDGFFSCTLDEITAFSNEYKKHIGLPLRIGGVSPSNVSREKLQILTNAGMNRIRMGIQSGSEQTKKLYRRNHSNDSTKKAVELIHEFSAQIPLPAYDIILDNPWETEDDLLQTLLFLASFPPPFYITLFSLTFYPGTELYDRAKAEGLLSDEADRSKRKNYYSLGKEYMNRLFRLLNSHVTRGNRLSERLLLYLASGRRHSWHPARLLLLMLEHESRTPKASTFTRLILKMLSKDIVCTTS